MYRSIPKYLVCLTLLLLLGCGEFKGRVTDKNGNPVDNVYIFLYYNGSWENADGSEAPKFTITDKDGYYEINPGNWDMLTLINDNGLSSYRIIPEYPGKTFDPAYREWDWDEALANCPLSGIKIGNKDNLETLMDCVLSYRTGFNFTVK